MVLNITRFVSDSISNISHLLTHLNPSSRENILLSISDITRLYMRLGDSSIDYMSRVRGISQRMQGITMDRIIPFFTIAILDHDRYPVLKSRYLTGDTALVNCNLLDLSSLLPRGETRQQALGLLRLTPSTTADRVSNTLMQPPPTGYPTPCPT